MEIRDRWGDTAVMKAAGEGHLETVKYLTEAGADINNRDNYLQTAVMRAAMYKHYKVCKHLIHYGADLSSAREYESQELPGNINPDDS